jgi:membrane protease YdiL (CAAX protease family)
MVAVATYVSGRYIFKDGFAQAGWKWGKPVHYLYALFLALFLWVLPSLLEQTIGMYQPTGMFSFAQIAKTFLLSFAITLIPAFSEEFGWRGYLLPRLAGRYSTRQALIIHGLITWIWHLPVLVVMGMQMGGNPLISIPLILLISLIPTTMHAVVFARLWNISGSLAVATLYHVLFDEVRDALQSTVGLGFLGQNWQMLALTLIGIALLVKGKWHIKPSTVIKK